MQRICRGAALLTALAVTSGACTYLAGDTCDDDACLANHPPVAVISDVGDDGALRVGNAGEVLVSARDSSDPDGDALSYAWEVAEPCTALVVGELTVQDLRLDNLPGGSTCVVKLTVTDARAKSASAEATLVIRNVGAHVTSTSGSCIAVFDPNSDAPQGTATTPFCSIAQAVIAASTFHLGEISLDGGTHVFSGRLLLDFPVTLRGGYLVGASEWVQSPGVTTGVVLQERTGDVDAQVSVTGNVTVGFARLSIRRNGQCGADCTLIGASESNLKFTDVIVGNPAFTNEAAARIYTSIAMSAANESSGAPKSFAATGLAIYGSANAATSIGIALDGAISAVLTNVAIHERARVSAGVRTTNTEQVRLVNSTLDIQPASGAGSQGYGIADGNRNTVSLEPCGPSTVICGGSTRLEVNNGVIVVTGADQVFGIDAQGTASLEAKDVAISVDGQQAWGILGGAQLETKLEGLDVTATTHSFRPGLLAFAVGVSDNFDASDSATLGAKAFRMAGGSVAVNIVGTGIAQAGAVNLIYTENVDISGVVLGVHGDTPSSSQVTGAAGIRLLGANGVSVTDSSIDVAGFKATDGVAGVVDGEPSQAGHTPRPGSLNVTLRNVDVATNVGVDLLTTAACVVMSKTGGGSIEGARADGSMTCRVSGAATAYGILLSDTLSFAVRNLNLVVSSATVSLPLFGTAYVGVHDGGLLPSDINQASDKLTISGNRIVLSQLDGYQIGVRVRGVASDRPTIDDNLIKIVNSTHNVGVLLQEANATVALNSLRLQGCSGAPCASAYAVGVYILHSESVSSSFLGNVLGVTGAMATVQRPAFVRHNRLASGWDASIGTVTANVFGAEEDSNEPPFVAGIASDTDDILSPASMAGYGVGSVPGSDNSHGSPVYCPDGVHGAATSPQRHAADGSVPVFGLDIDGEERRASGLDAGADFIADVCP